MTPPKKQPKPKLPITMDWQQREGWQPFTHRLANLSLGNQGFLTGQHKVERKQPKAG